MVTVPDIEKVSSSFVFYVTVRSDFVDPFKIAYIDDIYYLYTTFKKFHKYVSVNELNKLIEEVSYSRSDG